MKLISKHTHTTMQDRFATIWFKLTSFQNDEWKVENTQCKSKIVFIYCVVFCKFPTELGWFLPCSGVYPTHSEGLSFLLWVRLRYSELHRTSQGEAAAKGHEIMMLGRRSFPVSNGPLSGGHSWIFFGGGTIWDDRIPFQSSITVTTGFERTAIPSYHCGRE